MARDGTGYFSLPAGNPVVVDTIIDPNWANTTLAEIAAALTNSLDRTGQGQMLAPLKLVDGSKLAPGLTFGLDNDTGFYRLANNKFASVAGGINQAIYEANKMPPTGYTPLAYGAFGDGVNDDSAAWLALAAAVVADTDVNTIEFGQGQVINGQGRVYMIQNKVTLAGLEGVKIVNCLFRFMSGGNITSTNPMFVLSTTCRNVVFEACVFDGGKIGALVSLIGGSCKVFNCILYHFKGYGIEFTSAGQGDRAVRGCLINEWIGGADAEFTNNANYTADGVKFNDFDCRVSDCIIRFTGKGIHAVTGGFDIADVHVYNGGSGLVLRTNACNLQVEAASGHGRLKDCYLDNGEHRLYNHDVSFEGCFLFLDTDRVTIPEGFITLYANGDPTPDKFQAGNWVGMSNNLRNNTVPLVKCVDFGPNVWSADTSSIELYTSLDRRYTPEGAIVKLGNTNWPGLMILSGGEGLLEGGGLALASSTTSLADRTLLPRIQVVGEKLYTFKRHDRLISRNTSLGNVVLDNTYSDALLTIFGSGALVIHIPQNLEFGWNLRVIQEDTGATITFVGDGAATLHQFANSAGPWTMAGRYARAVLECVYNVDGATANVRISGNVV